MYAQLATLLLVVTTASALRCWRCGQYSDGVGSITPCTNHTGAKLSDCQSDARYCIKYVSELTTVRDCVPTCSEKASRFNSNRDRYPHERRFENLYNVGIHGKGVSYNPQAAPPPTDREPPRDWWGARTYCCNTDECNASSGPLVASLIATLVAPLIARLIAR